MPCSAARQHGVPCPHRRSMSYNILVTATIVIRYMIMDMMMIYIRMSGMNMEDTDKVVAVVHEIRYYSTLEVYNDNSDGKISREEFVENANKNVDLRRFNTWP